MIGYVGDGDTVDVNACLLTELLLLININEVMTKSVANKI